MACWGYQKVIVGEDFEILVQINYLEQAILSGWVVRS
jgi:hypothetical protein